MEEKSREGAVAALVCPSGPHRADELRLAQRVRRRRNSNSLPSVPPSGAADGSVPVRYGLRLNMDARYSAVKQQLQLMSGVHEASILICELADPLVKVRGRAVSAARGCFFMGWRASAPAKWPLELLKQPQLTPAPCDAMCLCMAAWCPPATSRPIGA